MLKKAFSIVLASPRMFNVRDDVGLAPSLAAALLKGLFEHPAWLCVVA